MNNTPHVLHELSAYLDGECGEPERIARHLQSCPDCARRYMELQKISIHVKALSCPETHPAFVTRVMARTAEAPSSPNWLSGFFPRLAAASCIAGLVIASALRLMPLSPIDAPSEATAQPVNLAWQDDARVVEALTHLLDTGAPVDLFGDLEESAESEDAPVALDSILESLADDVAVEEDFVDPFAQDDLSDVMDSLAEEDVQLLSELLETNGNEV